MSSVKEYICPSCGAPLHYVPGTEEVQCDNCGKRVPVALLETMQAGAEQNGFDWGDLKQNPRAHLENTRVYCCEACGAELEADANTVALRCPYCDNNVVLTDRVAGSLRPDAILPFKITPKELPDAVNRFYRKKKLLPKNFFEESKLSKIQGVYVPFWLFSCRVEGRVNLSALRVRTYSDSDYIYTETSTYLLTREGQIEFTDVPVDASEKMDNALMDALEPFELDKLVDFNDAYLAGYLADSFDSVPEVEEERANERMENSVLKAFANAEHGYSSVTIRSNAMRIEDTRVRYVLLPVYLLHNEYEGKKYHYAVNGRTGKVVGELPISKSRSLAHFFKFFGIAAAVVFALGMLLQ